jgi:hypothetical protein
MALRTEAVMEEIDIWRAAKQMVELYPEGAVMAAAQRADSAYEQGDMFNFELWRRITKAVSELERQKPDEGEAIN